MAVQTAPDKIALCLSGGGFRATLFHFGLVKALRTHSKEGRTALSAVDDVYSVSGGSILAAHLIRKWDRYEGSTGQFLDMEKEIIAFAGRNVRDRVIRRWLLTRWYGRRRFHWLRKQYESLVGSGSISSCYRNENGPRPPDLHILATSFRTGELCSFSPTSFEIERHDSGDTKPPSAPGGHLPLAYAVAASSAFPPLFPPVPLTNEMLRKPEDNYFEGKIHLSDGGVYDNLGFEKFRLRRARGEAQAGMLIVSNAGGSFNTDRDKTYSSMLSRNVRASDILMRRVGESTEVSVGDMPGVERIWVRIKDTAPDESLEPATQQLLRLVRTDLDAFGADLAGMLVDHGYRVGAARLTEQGWIETEQLPRCVKSGSDDGLSDVAANAANRTYKSFYRDFGDWKTVPLLWALFLLALAAVSITIYLAVSDSRARAAKEQAEHAALVERAKEADLKTKQVNDQAERLENVRIAVASGDLEAARRSLAGAIKATETLAENPDLDTSSRPAPIDVREAGRIIDETAPTYSIPRSAVRHDQRVFIQFAGVLTRAQIKALNQELKDAGWRAQSESGERTPKAAGLNQVRYSGGNRAAAQALADALNASGIVNRRVEPKENPDILPNVLEAWISR